MLWSIHSKKHGAAEIISREAPSDFFVYYTEYLHGDKVSLPLRARVISGNIVYPNPFLRFENLPLYGAGGLFTINEKSPRTFEIFV